jgi:8-oxo-dGTP pyrophosphatase MutT (NUDIX family)
MGEATRMSILAAFEEEHKHQNIEHTKAYNKTGFWGKAGAGCIVLAKSTGRILIAHRGTKGLSEPGTWGTIGGAIDSGEDPLEAVKRELKEETGYAGGAKVIPLHVFEKDSFKYYNYLVVVSEEFVPRLDWENQDAQWFRFGEWPRPLHFGLKGILSNSSDVAIIKKCIGKSGNMETSKEKDFKERLQIEPEKAHPDDNICSIGKSAKNGLWYGWSHRCFHGFKTKQQAIKFADEVSHIQEPTMTVARRMNKLIAAEDGDEHDHEEKLSGEPPHVQHWAGMTSSVRRLIRLYQNMSLKTEDAAGAKGTTGSSITNPRVVVDPSGMITIGFKMKLAGPFLMPTPLQAVQLKSWNKQITSALNTNKLGDQFAFVGVFVKPLNASTMTIGAAFINKQ